MSAEKELDTSSSFCAACGVAECDDIKLTTCNACKSVRYCSVKCQKNHRPKHKKACKKRAAKLRDKLLFKQPESTHLGDCPICMIPVPVDLSKNTFNTCCCKFVCNGCFIANIKREMNPLDVKCPFCRKPVQTDKEMEENVMKRIEANDPAAMQHKGTGCYKKGDYSSAFEYYSKAAKLGDIEASYKLSSCYGLGHGVEKDEKKGVFHLEEAAIGGHPNARYNLAVHEGKNGRIERAIKHLMIAAGQGNDDAIVMLRKAYAKGRISKENFASSLRAHQAAVDAIKSPQREEAEEYRFMPLLRHLRDIAVVTNKTSF
jgi:tetratricopeptide (TPR) repeat protein